MTHPGGRCSDTGKQNMRVAVGRICRGCELWGGDSTHRYEHGPSECRRLNVERLLNASLTMHQANIEFARIRYFAPIRFVTRRVLGIHGGRRRHRLSRI